MKFKNKNFRIIFKNASLKKNYVPSANYSFNNHNFICIYSNAEIGRKYAIFVKEILEKIVIIILIKRILYSYVYL
jgi:hypothetical protein